MSFLRDLVWQQHLYEERASVAHQIARYALALDHRDLPDDVVHQAKRCLLDALGCALGSRESPACKIIEDTIVEIGGAAESTVIGSGLRTSALNAALANAALVRFLDFNDLGGGGHNSDAIPSLFAVAEREHSSGRDLLTALVISYELGARFGLSVSPSVAGSPVAASLENKGWTKDIRAGFNQPPALGRLFGMTEEQIANAVGISMSHTLPLGILDAHREENTMAKNIRFGWAAHDAIMACLLARRGFTGPLRVIESDVGVRHVVANGDMDISRLTDFSGWHIRKVRFKTLATNGSTHGHTLATLGIVTEHDLQPEDIVEVQITAPVREARHTTAPPKKYPRSAENGDHSAFFANAMVIKYRSFGAESTDPSHFTDPQILDLIEKITVTPEPAMAYYEGASRIRTADGHVYERRVDVPHGMGDDPLSDDELEAKFTDLACRWIPAAQARRLAEACWGIDGADDVGTLIELTVNTAHRA
jgi:2-methylcitrate dehydratase